MPRRQGGSRTSTAAIRFDLVDTAASVATVMARVAEIGGRIRALATVRRIDGEPPHEFVGRLARFEFSTDGGDPVASIGPVQVLATGDIDADTVRKRIEARRSELQAEVERGEKKLANKGFVDKAPEEVVEEERQKLEAYRAEFEELGP